MKLPFKRKEEKQPEETLQSLQQAFNQVLYELGDLNYRKSMVKVELTKIESEINSRIQKADAMGVRAAKLRALAQEELAKKVKEGEEKKSDEATTETA